eukprot:2715278-Prymnesium_polylepis.1
MARAKAARKAAAERPEEKALPAEAGPEEDSKPSKKKRKWSAERKRVAKLERLTPSGRKVVAETSCSFCSASGVCEIDPADNAQTPYCRRCWTEYDAEAEAQRQRQAAAEVAARRGERARQRGGNREVEQARQHGAAPQMLVQRRQLFALLLECPEGVALDELPQLLCPRLRREGITWSAAELRSLRQCTADFAVQVRREFAGKGGGARGGGAVGGGAAGGGATGGGAEGGGTEQQRLVELLLARDATD